MQDMFLSPQDETSPIPAGDPVPKNTFINLNEKTDPGKPTLAKLNQVIARNSVSDQYQSEPAPVMGFGVNITATQKTEEQRQAERNIAAKQVDDELSANSSLIEEIMTKAFGKNGELADQYAITNKAGNKVPGPQLLKRIAELNDEYKGGPATLQLLTTKALKDAEWWIAAPDIQKIVEAKMPTKDQAEAELKPRIAKLTIAREAIVKAAVTNENTILQKKIDNLVKQRDEEIAHLRDSADMMTIFKKNELIGLKDTEHITDVMRFTESTHKLVANGTLSAEQGEKLIGDYARSKDQSFEQYKNEYVKEDLKPWVKSEMGDGLSQEFDAIVQRYNDIFREENLKSKSRLKRIANEQQILLKKEYNKLTEQYSKEQVDRFGEIYKNEAADYFRRKQGREIGSTMALVGTGNIPIPTFASGKPGVDAFLSTWGNVAQYASRFLSTLGIDNQVTRYVTEQGFKLQQEHERYKPEFGWDTLKSPGLMLQSFGSMAATALPTLATTVFTRNPYAGALVGSTLNASSMSGEVLDRKLAKGDNPAEALRASRNFFITDLGVTFVSDLVMGKLFKAALRGEVGWKAYPTAFGSEYIQEGAENIAQEIAIDPNKKMGALAKSSFIQSASLEAGVNSALFVGMGHAMGAIARRATAPDAQHLAGVILQKGEAYARAINKADHMEGLLSDEEFEKANNDISQLVSDLDEAKAAGLSQDEALLFVGSSTGAKRARALAATTTNSTLKASLVAKAEMLEKQASEVAERKVEIATVPITETQHLVETKEIADKINEAIAQRPADWADPFTEQTDEPAASQPPAPTLAVEASAIEAAPVAQPEAAPAAEPAAVEVAPAAEPATAPAATTEEVAEPFTESETQPITNETAPSIAEQTASDPAGGNESGTTETISQSEPQADPKENAGDPATGDNGKSEPPSARAKKKAFHEKVFDIKNPKSDLSLLPKLPQEKRQTKIDAMNDKLVTAVKDGTIDWNEYDEYADVLNNQYKNYGLPRHISRPQATAELEAEKEMLLSPEIAADMAAAEEEAPTVRSKPKKEKAKEVAKKIRKAKVANDKAFDALLGIPVAIYNGAVETIAKIVEAGGSLADGIRTAVNEVAKTFSTVDAGVKRKQFERKIAQMLQEHGILANNGSASASLRRRAKMDSLAGRLRSYKTNRPKVNLAGGIDSNVYNEGLDKAIAKIMEGGSSADAAEVMTQHIKEQTGLDEVAIRNDVRKGFNKAGITITSPKRMGGTVSMSMRDLFMHSLYAKKSMAKVIEEIQAEVSKYFSVNGMDLSKGRIAAAMKALASLATVDPSIERIVDVVEEIDSIMAQQGHADDIAKATGLIRQFKRMLRKSPLLTDRYINELRNVLLPSPSNVLMVDGQLTDYIETLEGLLNSFGNKQGKREISLQHLADFTERMKQLESIVADYKQSRLEDKLEAMRTKGEIAATTTVEDYLASKEKTEEEIEQDEEDRNEKRDEETKAYLDSLRHLQESLRLMIDASEHQLESDELEVAVKLSLMDLTRLSQQELYQFNDIINNILLDGETVAAGQFVNRTEEKYNAQQSLEESGIQIRGLGKLFGAIDTSNMHNFSNLLEGITFNKRYAARLRHLVVGEFEAGVKRVQNILNGTKQNPGVVKQFIDMIEKNKIEVADQYQIGVFAFLNQYDRSDANHFQQLLAKIIDDNVEALSAGIAGDDNKADRKAKLKAARLTVEALKFLGLINNYTISKAGVIKVERNAKVSAEMLDKMLTREQRQVYEFARNSFESISYDLKRAAGLWFGVDLKLHDNYFPMIADYISSKDRVTNSNVVSDAIDILGDPSERPTAAPVDRIKNRVKLAGKNKYYQMSFVDVFLNSYYQGLLTIHGGKGISKSASLVNSRAFADFIAGGKNQARKDGVTPTANENVRTFQDMVARIFQDMRYPPFRYPGYTGWFDRVTSIISEQMIKTLLSRADQLVNQYVPNWIATFIEAGPEATMMATRLQSHAAGQQAMKNMGADGMDTAEAFDQFLLNFSGQFRSPLGLAATERHIKTLDQSTFWRNAGDYVNKLNAIGTYCLETADKGVFHIGLLSAYIQHQVKTGKIKSAFDFDLQDAVANPDMESIAYAEQVAARINNESQKAYRAEVVRPKGNIRFLNLYLLGGYGLNSFMGAYNSGRTLVSARATTEDKQVALTNLAGYTAQIFSFNMLKMYVTPIAYKALAKMILEIGLHQEVPDLDEEQRRKLNEKKWTKVLMASASDLLFSGANSLIRSGGDALLNGVYAMYSSSKQQEMKEAGENPKGTIYDKYFKPIFIDDSNYGGTLNMAAKTFELGKEAWEDNDTRGLTQSQKDAMDWMDRLALMSWALRSGDLYKTANAGRVQIQAGKSTGGGGGGFRMNMKFGGSKFGLNF